MLDAFRFHMTLTDSLSPEQEAWVRPLAEASFAPVLPRPFVVGGLAVFAEDAGGTFHEVHRARLG